MRYKLEVSDSGGNSKSPSKKTTKSRNPPTESLPDDGEISKSVRFRLSEESSIQESHVESEEKEENSEATNKNQHNEVEFNQNNSSPENSVSVKSIFSADDLSPDDEIYTLQCPEGYNKQDLINKNLDFTKLNPSVTNKDEVFQLQLLNSDKKFITLALPKDTSGGALIKLPLKGHIIIQKAVDVTIVEPLDDDNCDKDRVKFPDDLKVRHPLLGVDWKAHVDLADTALIKYCSRKRSKKIKKENIVDDNLEMIKVKQESSESDIGTPKKKRRKFES